MTTYQGPRNRYANAEDYQAAIRIARDYGEIVEPEDFAADGTIDGMVPDEWAAAMFGEDDA